MSEPEGRPSQSGLVASLRALIEQAREDETWRYKANKALDTLIGSLPTDAPTDATGQDRRLLNAYGRRCYDAGRESVIGSLPQQEETPRHEANPNG